ncbi:hypothetical protein [Segniliparus rugosus]|uniref:Uncharacterized protein n=1 Tax=Segniliparus rugosus (strain ATCC BAA-974 / DSM 45345 / CCUG 50838 / CIP 108380 / JCM 13579 / CDC 945) TaxID=679197 RepID=E5XT52_SEGRC|nr:hypothetical protein [Segniliparus rugosus]EFV12463.2 hypothetical protein HMPREF9336_02674 [Segniliparus rugosus ATCC BAA-974]
MSAFVVAKTHVDALVSALVGVCGYPHEWAGALGHKLWSENFRSVNYLYEEDEPTPVYDPELVDGPFDLVAALKAASCMDYQSCEHPEWKQSEAFALLELLRAEIFKLRPELGEKTTNSYGETCERWQTLPEAESALWEVEDARQVLRASDVYGSRPRDERTGTTWTAVP